MRRAFPIIIVCAVLFLLTAPQTKAASASLYLAPNAGTYNVGSTFSITIRVNTDSAVNAVEAVLFFDNEDMEVTTLSKTGSILTLWPVEPSFSNSAGSISFGGGLPTPGYTGSSGRLLIVTFRVKTAGTGSINFSSGAVLANDGSGTNILTGMTGGAYTFLATSTAPPAQPAAPSVPSTSQAPPAPQISSATHPDQTKWYNNSSPQFSWLLTPDITDVSLRFDQAPDSNPGNISDGLYSSKPYEGVSEGVSYFHLKLKNKKGWSEISHYKIQVDTTPPLPFEITSLDGKETTNPQPTLLFETKDELSGLDRYEIKIGDGDFFGLPPSEIQHNPFKMPVQAPGEHSVLIKALDKAGNFSQATTEILIKPGAACAPGEGQTIKIGTMLISYGIIIILLIALLILLVFGMLLVWYKVKLARARLKKEIREAEESLHGGFDILREDIGEQLQKLEKIKKARNLTARERALQEKLKKDLNIVEKYIRKEIKDIERQLD